jgi:surface carbohydrate biosynthesis protein
MNIYFLIDELSRDAVVASALKKKFAEKGHNLVYGNRATNRLLKIFHGAFDVIICHRPHIFYDNWGEDWMSWRVRFITLSTEALGIICKDHEVMAKTLLDRDYFEGNRRYVERIDALCFWGPKQLQAVKDHASEVAHKCHVVGHPRHDVACVQALQVDPARQIKTKAVGVITRAVALNDYFNRSPLEWFRVIFNDHANYEFHNKITGEKLPSKRAGASPADNLTVQAIDVETTLRIIRSLLEAGHRVTLRVHPKEHSDAWKSLLARCGLEVEISNAKLPVTQWLKGLSYLVGPPSTSFYDGVMLGVTPISICSLNSRRRQSVGELWEDNNRLMAHVFKPATIDELLAYVESGTQNFGGSEILQILKEEANFPACANSLDEVVSICTRDVYAAKNQKLLLASFKLARYFYFKVWRVRNRFLGRKENSAMFAMGLKESRFIDGLSYSVSTTHTRPSGSITNVA